MILEAAAILVCPIVLGILIGGGLRKLVGHRLTGAASLLGGLLLPMAVTTALTVYVPLVGL
jgi:hypothetical protein